MRGRTWTLRVVMVLLLIVFGSAPGHASDKNGSESRMMFPADVDERVPVVKPGVACPLSKLVQETGARAAQLVTTLQQFSATDRVQDTEERNNGHVREVSSTFNYVAEIKHPASGPAVEEYRENTSRDPVLQTHWNDSGTAALALLFHPKYVQDYILTCEGQTELNGRPAWQVRFAQHPERGNAFHIFRVPYGIFPVRLKGRAWISCDNFEVMRLETDLIEKVHAIRLQREHSIVEYGPVGFKKNEVQLWLPQVAELYIDHNGRRYRRRHVFSDFQLFWVDTAQQDKQPKVMVTEP